MISLLLHACSADPIFQSIYLKVLKMIFEFFNKDFLQLKKEYRQWKKRSSLFVKRSHRMHQAMSHSFKQKLSVHLRLRNIYKKGEFRTFSFKLFIPVDDKFILLAIETMQHSKEKYIIMEIYPNRYPVTQYFKATWLLTNIMPASRSKI